VATTSRPRQDLSPGCSRRRPETLPRPSVDRSRPTSNVATEPDGAPICCFRFAAPSIMARSVPALGRDSSLLTIRFRNQSLRPDTPNLQAVPLASHLGSCDITGGPKLCTCWRTRDRTKAPQRGQERAPGPLLAEGSKPLSASLSTLSALNQAPEIIHAVSVIATREFCAESVTTMTAACAESVTRLAVIRAESVAFLIIYINKNLYQG
jgi:hypothetical protein